MTDPRSGQDAHTPHTPDAPISRHHRTAAPDETRDGHDSGPHSSEGEGNPVRLAILAAVVVLLGLWGGWPLMVVVLGVVLMIFLHELGHFMAAKLSDMQVTEFFIGFGPRIWSFRRGETEYGLKAIPAGAYVKITGMSTLEEVEPEKEHRTYRVKSYPRRMLVAVAGSAMHFAQALVLLFVLYAFVGIPGGGLIEERTWEIGEVVEGSAADDADLQPGDQVVALDGRSVESFGDLRDAIAARPGENALLTVKRDGAEIPIRLTIGVNEQNPDMGFLGVSRELVTSTVGPVEAIGSSFREFGAQTTATLGFFGDFFSPDGISGFADSVVSGNDRSTENQVPDRSGGTTTVDEPDEGRIVSIVGAVQLGANLTENGLLGFLVFFVAINVTIGIFNLLPVLPLDGGHVVIATYERIRELFKPKGERYYVDMMKLMPFVYAVFVALVVLGLSTMWLDIVDPAF